MSASRSNALRGGIARILSILLLLLAVAFGGVIVAFVRARDVVHRVPRGTERSRFGVPLAIRKDVFARIAGSAARWRAALKRRIRDQPYYRELDFHRRLRDMVKRVARSRSLQSSQVWLIVDEGIRRGWKSKLGAEFEVVIEPVKPGVRW